MARKSRTFIKVLDEFPDHPKVVGLSDSAFRAYIELVCYCSRYLTDGTVPESAARKCAAPKTVSELVSAGLLDRHSGAVHIHDYLDHQTSRARVEQLRAMGRQNVGKGDTDG